MRDDDYAEEDDQFNPGLFFLSKWVSLAVVFDKLWYVRGWMTEAE